MKIISKILCIFLLSMSLTACGKCEHEWVEATCTEPKTCSKCGETEGEPIGHEWVEATCEEPMTCKKCGSTDGKPLGHISSELTCTQGGVCERCGKELGPLGHEWVEATCTEPKKCNRCGETDGEPLGHTTTNGKCERCGEEIVQPIEFSGSGDKIITGVDVPEGEYVAYIDIDSTRHYDVKWYYGQDEYDYNLLVNNSGNAYHGAVLLKDGDVSAVKNGEIDINSKGNWNIKIEPLSGTISGNSVSGNGDVVTGLFEGTGNRTVFNIKINSTRHYDVKLYKYNGGHYDYDLLVNDSGEVYDGQVASSLEKGAKYFFTVNSQGDWEISW